VAAPPNQDPVGPAPGFSFLRFDPGLAAARNRPRPAQQGCIKPLRSMRQGWVPILSLAFVPHCTVNLNRIPEMHSIASQLQLARTPLAGLGVPWWQYGTTMDIPWYHRTIAGASCLSQYETPPTSPPAIVNPILPCPCGQNRSVKTSQAPGRAGGNHRLYPEGQQKAMGRPHANPRLHVL